MDLALLDFLRKITPEEEKILSGAASVNQSLYTASRDFIVDKRKLLAKDKLIEIRPHTRFIHFPRHKHNYVEMVYMCAGSTTHIINDTERITLEEGGLLLLNQNAAQEILPAGEGDIAVNFIILPQFFDYTMHIIGTDNILYNFIISALASDNGLSSYLHFDTKNILPVQNIIENMIWTIIEKPRSVNTLNKLSMGLLFLNLLNFCTSINQGCENQYEQQLVYAALKYIDANYTTGSLNAFCRQYNVKPYAVSRLLKKHTSKNFKELLKDRRLQQAAYLLRNTALPTETVFHTIGYENSSYFYQIFYEKYGKTPRRFRQDSLTSEMQGMIEMQEKENKISPSY